MTLKSHGQDCQITIGFLGSILHDDNSLTPPSTPTKNGLILLLLVQLLCGNVCLFACDPALPHQRIYIVYLRVLQLTGDQRRAEHQRRRHPNHQGRGGYIRCVHDSSGPQNFRRCQKNLCNQGPILVNNKSILRHQPRI